MDPVFPNIANNQNDGFNAIDSIYVWNCALSQFITVSDIPQPFRSKWAHLVDQILQKWEFSSNEDEENQALKAFLFLPQLLLRQTKRAGRRQRGMAELSHRFDLASNEEWETLIEKWRKDLNRRTSKQKKQDKDKENDEKLREKVLTSGKISRAANLIDSHGIASLDTAETMEALRSKFPERRRPLPDTVPRGECLDSLPAVKDHLLQIEEGSAGGNT